MLLRFWKSSIGCFTPFAITKKAGVEGGKAAIINSSKLMEKIPNNPQIEPEIVQRIIGRREGFVLHKGLIDMLSFYIEIHPLDSHININVRNRLSTNGIRCCAWQNIFVENWGKLSGSKLGEVIHFDSGLDICGFFECFGLIKQIDSSNEIRHWQKVFVVQSFLEQHFSVQIEFPIFQGTFATDLRNIE